MRFHRRSRCGLLVAILLTLAACNQAASPSPPVAMERGQSDIGSSAGSSAGSDAGRLPTARIIRVQDGDSFVARLEDGSRLTIRLSGIDAPERNQADADRSRQNLRRLLDGRELRLQVAKTDAYGRAVAQVFVVTDRASVDVGMTQVQEGMAWYFRRYRNDLPAASRERYEAAERSARKAMRGLWQAGDPEPPWDFRQRREAHDPAARR